MKRLLDRDMIEQWKFGPASIDLLKGLIEEIESGNLMP